MLAALSVPLAGCASGHATIADGPDAEAALHLIDVANSGNRAEFSKLSGGAIFVSTGKSRLLEMRDLPKLEFQDCALASVTGSQTKVHAVWNCDTSDKGVSLYFDVRASKIVRVEAPAGIL
jgi:hypothetical protein